MPAVAAASVWGSERFRLCHCLCTGEELRGALAVLGCPKAILTCRLIHHSCKAAGAALAVSKLSHQAPGVLVPQDAP